MHYLVLASESDDVGDIWVVQRTFTSDSALTKEQLEHKFLVAHWKENAEESASEPIDNWTEEDFQTLYEEGNSVISVDHFYQSNTPIHLEEVAK